MKLTAKDLEKAIIYATEKHKGVVRQGDGTPYILHPLSVLFILAKVKKSNNYYLLAVAAILHDVVEDCGVTLEEIAEKFGHAVAALVSELTSDKSQIELKTKPVYLLEKMLGMTSYALRLKLADRLHNVSDLESLPPKKREKSINETKYILEGLVERKLTKTHKKLISQIWKYIKKAEKKAEKLLLN
jgi:(p)ppGpp synthase/HD superfamily hydrolase